MKLFKHLQIPACALMTSGFLLGQNPAETVVEPLPESLPAAATETVANLTPSAVEAEPSDQPPPADLIADPAGNMKIPADLPAAPAAPAGAPGAAAPAGAPFAPLEQQKQEMQKSEEGFIIKDAALNDIFQYLAKAAGRQYFHNSKIVGPDYLVTGHLNDGTTCGRPTWSRSRNSSNRS